MPLKSAKRVLFHVDKLTLVYDYSIDLQSLYTIGWCSMESDYHATYRIMDKASTAIA